MKTFWQSIMRPILFSLDGEYSHNMAIKALKAQSFLKSKSHDLHHDSRLAFRLWDLDFATPIGLSAGFDKNAEVIDPMLNLGFGFVEVGTVTPKPQLGNAKPRIFRLLNDQGIINRLGFNNDGHAAARARLWARRAHGGIVGVNIGANKETQDRIADYVAGIQSFADLASYFTVNVSSPNTPGLRDLQAKETLKQLLIACLEERNHMAEKFGRCVPLLLKIAPDLADEALKDIVDVAHDVSIDGMIISNTTLARDRVNDKAAREIGGLSGRPLFSASTRMLARARYFAGPDLPLIGVGGVENGKTAFAKIAAGASLVQLYTGLIYKGPCLVYTLHKELLKILEERGFVSIRDAIGIETMRWLEDPSYEGV